jgi:small GTP-binding protein
MIKKKICMAGLFGVGKTSLVRRFVESIFSDRYLTTVGVKIDRKDVTVDGRTVSLAIWDIAGEDDQAQFRLSNVRGASGVILVADGCRRASLEKAVDLQRRIGAAIGAVPFVLVVNKADLRDEWEIQPDAIAALAAGGWHTFEASAKTGQAVEQVFETLTRDMLERDESERVDDDEE